MKTLNYLKKLTGILLLTVAFTSCSDDDNDIVEFVPTESIVDIAFATQDLSDLYSALTKYPDLVDMTGEQRRVEWRGARYCNGELEESI